MSLCPPLNASSVSTTHVYDRLYDSYRLTDVQVMVYTL
jgi:hypothetical protein